MVIPFEKQLMEWQDQQRQWIDQQIALNPTDKLWIYINNVMAQFDGVLAGYNYAASNVYAKQLAPFNSFQLSLINSVMDYLDVIEALIFTNQTMKESYMADKLHTAEWRTAFKDWQKMRGLHCSGLVKVTPLLDDLFFSHSTWISYYMMNRIFKHYTFASTNVQYATTTMSFSSYPGAINSLDDYYIMDNGMATMETTNDQYNPELWKYVRPQQLFTWMRVRVANQVSSNGPEWISYFERYNSGTYNNQWMILDYKLFVPGQPLKDNLLWIAEQIPGNVSSIDVTRVLERGYWASYNVPAIEYIYRESGNEAMAKLQGSASSYDLAPRARIFRRDANNVTSLQDAMRFMRYNNYLQDEIENKDPVWAIMARGDLRSEDQGESLVQLFGGTDTKLANLTMLQRGECIAKSGPTNDNTATFTWTGQWKDRFHYALPEVYDFDWQHMLPTL